MRNAIILHGKPAQEVYENPDLPKPHEANWLPWLGEKLKARGVVVAIPALPEPYFPIYEAWKAKFETHNVDRSTALVGHSAGAEFILRWLSEHGEVEVERVVLVAPYRDYAGKYGEFSQYQLDPDLSKRVGRLTVFNSLDDTEPIKRRAREIAETIPGLHYVELDGFGHFKLNDKMQTNKFPELLNELYT